MAYEYGYASAVRGYGVRHGGDGDGREKNEARVYAALTVAARLLSSVQGCSLLLVWYACVAFEYGVAAAAPCGSRWLRVPRACFEATSGASIQPRRRGPPRPAVLAKQSLLRSPSPSLTPSFGASRVEAPCWRKRQNRRYGTNRRRHEPSEAAMRCRKRRLKRGHGLPS